MSIKAQTQIPNLGNLSKKVQREFRAKVRAIHDEVTKESKRILSDSIINSGKVASGRLLKSVSSKFVSDKAIDGFTSQIGFKKPGSGYAVFANYGRGSGGMPPIRAIKKWADSKGISPNAVWAIAKSIEAKGTEDEGNDAFFEQAQKDIQTMLKRTVNKRLAELKRSYR